MWVSRRLFNRLEERVSALERKEQERIELEKYREEHGDEIIKEARELLRKPTTKVVKRDGKCQRVSIDD